MKNTTKVLIGEIVWSLCMLGFVVLVVIAAPSNTLRTVALALFFAAYLGVVINHEPEKKVLEELVELRVSKRLQKAKEQLLWLGKREAALKLLSEEERQERLETTCRCGRNKEKGEIECRWSEIRRHRELVGDAYLRLLNRCDEARRDLV